MPQGGLYIDTPRILGQGSAGKPYVRFFVPFTLEEVCVGSIRHTKEVASEKDAAMQREHWWNHGRYGHKPWGREKLGEPQGNGDCRDKAEIWKRSQGRRWGLEERDLGNLCALKTSELEQMVM